MKSSLPTAIEEATAIEIRQSCEKNKQATLDALNTLRDTNRLAIHMWEECGPYKISQKTLDILNNPIGKGLQMSMSLLPNSSSGKSLCPFEVSVNNRGYCGYLVDMTQTKQTPPIVYYASPDNLNTGTSCEAKDFHGRFIYNANLRQFYLEHRGMDSCSHKPTDGWMEKVRGREGKALASQQLDILARHYETEDSEPSSIHSHNEIVVTANISHVNAIAVPLYINAESPKWAKPLVELSGALLGLSHLKLKPPLNFPVVLYQVNPPCPNQGEQQTKAGDFIYVGKGEKELTIAAINAIRELQKENFIEDINDRGDWYTPEVLNEAVFRQLRLKLNVPLSMQQSQIHSLCTKSTHHH